MLKIEGDHAMALVYTDLLDSGCQGQIRALCNQESLAGAKIRIMPDVHAGAGCVIGSTIKIQDKIIPNLVGVDIGCGISVAKIEGRMDFNRLDNIIHQTIPFGFKIRSEPHRFISDINLADLVCARHVNLDKAALGLGTLGGGNHFIEVATDRESGANYLLVHSGSRQAGFQAANYYQKMAGDARPEGTPYELAWLSDQGLADYLHDMEILLRYAEANRKAILMDIAKKMKWKLRDIFSTVHNYVDPETMILRKGAISANAGEQVIIPLNMRDGSLVCIGKGNPDWNYSAPHGAGRLFSRAEARERLTLTQFKKDMTNIYSSCIARNTIDESPGAYKPMQSIIDNIEPTVEIKARLIPVYNFKAGGEE